MINTSELNMQQVWSETDMFTPFRYQQFYKHFTKDTKSVLDCGCNTGRGGKILKDLNPDLKIYGIELLEERLKQIPDGIYEALFFGSAAEIPLEDNSLDAIVAGEVVEHIPEDELHQVLKEFNRVLKKGGIALLTTPNPHSVMIKLGRTGVLQDPSHVNIMTPPSLREKLERNSFKVASIFGSGKASKYVGENFPYFDVYGSYMVKGIKN
ncbi:ubiquinone/menaquinone biosynthesis C-methylase UbiE [Pontibacter aydingkolensis]|uniref:Class I SAM-dependent methyltransferase n=1 Tax=Pontibacter aydingkolensis TaxID=1911536 RepID=A0ABS7CSP8_9BACT|nr:class I SAM-dependent methyltransferase [Pontibacter aydingkolensis]MBW7466726.1 class I SAM-dependent methyltransferase [Pontibacter aydingkolensis]